MWSLSDNELMSTKLCNDRFNHSDTIGIKLSNVTCVSLKRVHLILGEQKVASFPLAYQADGALTLPVTIRPYVRTYVRTQTLHCPHEYYRLVLKMRVIDVDLQDHFRPFWLRILGNSACPRNNSSQNWARMTTFGMHSEILAAAIKNGSHWP